jgi:hypothetical protein
MVSFAKVARSAGHAIGEVTHAGGKKISKVKRAGILGSLGVGLGAGVGVGAYQWVSHNGNVVLVTGALVALYALRRRM